MANENRIKRCLGCNATNNISGLIDEIIMIGNCSLQCYTNETRCVQYTCSIEFCLV